MNNTNTEILAGPGEMTMQVPAIAAAIVVSEWGQTQNIIYNYLLFLLMINQKNIKLIPQQSGDVRASTDGLYDHMLQAELPNSLNWTNL